MSDFKIIETQEAFDDAIKKRLERERITIEKEMAEKYKEYISPDNAKALEESHNNAIAEIKKQLDDLTRKNENYQKEKEESAKRVADAESKLLKSKVAHENGVPFELADRLIGQTEDELKKDAEKVAGYLKPTNAAPLRTTEPNPYIGNPDAASKMAANQALAQMIPQLLPPNN